MAFYIEINKVAETEEYVEYSFGQLVDVGMLRLDKVRGTVTILSECPLDQHGHWSLRATVKLTRHWKEGILPEKTEWAS
ncbi:hypothetical protein DM872_01270 [Pseudomonas taiwanensis]|uniref:hypothetical protein n=1 Tax=Pseudomonas taiwanensis TaxID=470150 RepID=UPI0015BCC9DE|nr:hypothetical protein [Pseudomonas taiwanensis]NWL75487.1 hypothetical protein [Pseudomonas taiwanensis]